MQKGVENMNVVKQNVRGILLCLLLAVPAWLLGKWIPVVGGPVFAILAGMLLTLFLKDKTRWQPGVNFTSKKLLQAAVVLLGFGLNLKVVLETGRKSLPIILSTITTSLVIAFLLKKLLKVPSKSATLIGVGSSICGGSAIAATAPVIDADDEEIAQSISVIFLFNIAAALIFPSLGGLLGLSDAGVRPVCGHRRQRHLLGHRRRGRLGRHPPQQHPGGGHHRQAYPDAGHHPHHTGAGLRARPEGKEHGGGR